MTTRRNELGYYHRGADGKIAVSYRTKSFFAGTSLPISRTLTDTEFIALFGFKPKAASKPRKPKK